MRAKVIWYFIFLIGNNFVFFSLGFISICQCLFGFLMRGCGGGCLVVVCLPFLGKSGMLASINIPISVPFGQIIHVPFP